MATLFLFTNTYMSSVPVCLINAMVGTITACAPKDGPVEYLTLAKAEVVGAAGQVLARFAELPLVSAVLTDVSVTERASVRLRGQQLVAIVALIKSLGGGWQVNW